MDFAPGEGRVGTGRRDGGGPAGTGGGLGPYSSGPGADGRVGRLGAAGALDPTPRSGGGARGRPRSGATMTTTTTTLRRAPAGGLVCAPGPGSARGATTSLSRSR